MPVDPNALDRLQSCPIHNGATKHRRKVREERRSSQAHQKHIRGHLRHKCELNELISLSLSLSSVTRLVSLEGPELGANCRFDREEQRAVCPETTTRRRRKQHLQIGHQVIRVHLPLFIPLNSFNFI